MTHTLQVLHTLQWHHPSKTGRALAQAPTRDCHSYTHTLLGGVDDVFVSSNDSPMKVQENTALLSSCGLAGAPLRVSLLGLGGKECSGCVHRADAEDVGLSTPSLPVVQLFVCDLRPCLAGAEKPKSPKATAAAPIQPEPSHLESKGRCRSICGRGIKTDSTYYTLLSLPYNTLSANAPIKQASLRSCTLSLIERKVEALGNLNKVYRAHFAWPAL